MSATTIRRLAFAWVAASALAGCAGRQGLDIGEPLEFAGGAGSARIWEKDLGRAIEHPPVATRGSLLVATTDARLWRLSLDGGTPLWRRKLYSSPTASPLVCGSTVVVATDAPRNMVEGVDLETGRVLWTEPFALPVLPAAFDTMLVAAARGGRVVRMDAMTGTRQWEARLPGAGWRPPAVRAAEGRVLVPVRPDSLIALDLATGKRSWARALGGLPLLCASGDPFAAVTETGVLWILDPVSGETIAQRDLGGLPAGPPVVRGDAVWVTLRAGRLLRLRLPDLETQWSGSLASPLVTPPALGDSIAVQAGPRGEVAVFDLGGGPGTTLHHPELLWAAPLVLEDAVVVGGAKGTLIVYRRVR